MASVEARSLDISYSNLIQIVLSRTMEGFVPNFASGLHVSYDRTEPQIGAYVTLQIYKKWGDAWVVDIVLPALEAWNDWVWEHRRGEGAFAGPDGHADLVVLGSDPNSAPKPFDGGSNTLQDARFESGLDNSPMYDGIDDSSDGAGPVRFDDRVTHHMELYDVGMTGLYLSDTRALIELATERNNPTLAARLQTRFDRVSAAITSKLWNTNGGPTGEGVFANVLFNGSFYERNSPTALFPLISGVATPAQAASLVAFAASPLGLCMLDGYMPVDGADYVVTWYDGVHDNAMLVSAGSTQDILDGRTKYNYVRVEALTLLPPAGPAPGLVPLGSWFNTATRDWALTNSTTTPPAAGYAFVRSEGWCWAAPPTPTTGFEWTTTKLTLWYSAALKDYKTCGSAGCETDSSGYVNAGVLCYAFDVSTPETMPCKFSGNSIARADAAFYDNNYWRGRIWGPHLQLLYWGLANPVYAGVPGIAAARAALVKTSAVLVIQEWTLFRQVTENYNGIIGVGEDVGNADPFYHWGALPSMMAILEAGKY